MRFGTFSAVAALALVAGAANAAIITPGFYRMHNHPDGNSNPPLYGVRFDEIVDATSGHDIFTLSLDHPSSNMTLWYTGSQIYIAGWAYGGRDIGSAWANDAYLGVYYIEMKYTVGVGLVASDATPANRQDISVNTANHSNFGKVTLPGGSTVNLTDEKMDYSLRIGDEDNDAGHRGFSGVSVWGWMSYVNPTGINHVESTDWLATLEVPAPASVALMGMGALVMTRRRR